MSNFLQSKAIIWFCLLAGIIAIATVMAARRYGNAPTTPPVELKVETKDVPTSQFPENFPTDLPIEKGAEVTQNYTATTNDGRFQATRTFQTAKTLDENYKIYRDYSLKNGWELGTGVDQENIKVVTATKGNLTMTVTISQSTSSQAKTVNITITEVNAVAQ